MVQLASHGNRVYGVTVECVGAVEEQGVREEAHAGGQH